MALTVAQVVALPELALVVRTRSAPLERQVRWVAVSELLDPTPWLEGGDLLLTTGMAIVDDPVQALDYVQRLVAADVAALGFGVGLTHQAIPGALIAAAEKVGLPVVEVPQPVPFVAVSKAVSGLLTAEEYAESAASFESQRRLIRAALADDSGTDELAAVLSRQVGGFCLHLDRHGTVLAARPRAAAARAADFTVELDRLRPRGVLASSAVSSTTEHVVIVPIGVKGAAQGFLVVGSGQPLTPADQAVVSVAVSLLSWQSSRPGRRAGRLDAWRRVLLDSALDRGLDDHQLADVGLTSLRPRRAVATLWRGAGGRPIPDDLLDLLAALPGVLACRRPSGDVVGLASVDEEGRLSTEVSATAANPEVAALGVSCVLDLTVAGNVRQAIDQAERAAAIGSGMQSFEDQATRGLTSLLDAATTHAWARGYLGDLLTTAEGVELTNTLHAWLDQHGQVDAAAHQLGIHRHTVRHRVRRAEAVLGTSLDDPGVRADLWFALEAIRTG